MNKKYYVVLIAGAVSGATAFNEIETMLTQNRYPIEKEYAIINACVNLGRKTFFKESINKKTDICICSIKKSMNEVKYSDYKNDKSDFIYRMSINVDICS